MTPAASVSERRLANRLATVGLRFVTIDDLIELLEEGRDPAHFLDWNAFTNRVAAHLLDGLDEEVRDTSLRMLPEVFDQLTLGMSPRRRDNLARILEETARQIRDRRTMAGRPLPPTAGAPGGRGNPPRPPVLPPVGPEPSPGPIGGAVLRLRYDLVDPYAVQYAANHALKLAGRVSRDARDTVMQTVADGLLHGVRVEDVARQISETVGLHPRWAGAVRRYERGLIGRGVDRSFAVSQARAYAGRLRAKRGMMIARTEIMRASNHGRLVAWEVAAGAGLVDRNTMRKEWVAAPDSRSINGVTGPCHLCGPMNGVQVSTIDGEFLLPNSRLVTAPPAHPHCRCTVSLIPPPVPDYVYTDDEWMA